MLQSNRIWSNTIPSKFQSYLLAGKPIIGCVDGITKKLIERSKSGLVNKPNDFKGLAKSILRLQNSPKKDLRLMGYNAKSYVDKNFNLIKISNILEKALYSNYV